MAQTRVITAVDPATGARLTRRTARAYVAVVVVGDPAQGNAQAATWCGRPDLAEKALRKFSRPDARLAPVVGDPWADAAPALPGEARPGSAAPDARPVLPGEAEPPAPVAQDGPAPVLPDLAGCARALADDLATPAPTPDSLSPAPTGDAWAGQPWDPGTAEARARVALQGERVATLWPIAQAVRGAGFDLPPVWWADGPILAGEWQESAALAVLSTDRLRAAAAALAALPPVTTAQARALRLCRGDLATV